MMIRADRTAKEGRIRVCILAPSLRLLGGQSRQAAYLLETLFHEPALKMSFIPHDPILPGVLRRLQGVKYVRTIVTTAMYLALLAVRLPRVDVVHAFSASYYSYLLSVLPAILFARVYHKQVVLNYRSGEAEDHLKRWRLTAAPTMRLATAIVVPSDYLADVFARFGLVAHPLANILDLSLFRFRQRTPLRPVFLCTRLLEPLYNVGCVLRAFAAIQKRYPEASLTIAGDGSMRSELEQLSLDLGLQRTEFIGKVPYEAMPRLYDAADVYLNGNTIDNAPASIIESFASGLPVVSTDAGGIPYILTHEETGLMVKCDDHEAMAASAMRLLENGALASRLARNARAWVEGAFSQVAVRQQWLSLYERLSGEQRTRNHPVDGERTCEGIAEEGAR